MTEQDKRVAVAVEIPIGKIKVAPNPRGRADAAAMKELVASIRRNGVLQPIVCSTDGSGEQLMLVAGSRRLFAAKEAGLTTIPTTVWEKLSEDKILDIQLEENLQREDLDPIEEGKYLAEYRGKCTIEELAKRIGKSPKHIAQRISLHERLLPAFQKMVRTGALPIGRAQVIAALSTDDQRNLDPSAKGLQPWDREQIEEMITRGSAEQFHGKVLETLHRISARPWKKVKLEAFLDGGKKEMLPCCDECMSRSDRQGYLLPDGADEKDARCLNSSCWGRQLKWWHARQIEKLRADGRRILAAEEIKKVSDGYSCGKDEYPRLGSADGRDLPYGLDAEKFRSKCRVCANLGHYIGKERNRPGEGLMMACLDPACYTKRERRGGQGGEKSYQAKEREAFSETDLKASAQAFATAAWAMAKARGVQMPGADLNAMAAAVLVLAEQVHVNSKERYALKWILEEGGCKGAGGLNSFGKLLTVTFLDVTARSLAYFLAVGGNLFEGKTGEIAGDLSELMPKARKLFSPSNALFLETLLRSSIQSVGRHYKVKGIGGKRDDAIKAIAAAKLTSETSMLKALEQCFAGKKGSKK